MSSIETAGMIRLLTRAQNWAITRESAPRSLKKWPSTGTCSTRTTPASTSARSLSASVAASGVPTALEGWVVSRFGRQDLHGFLCST